MVEPGWAEGMGASLRAGLAALGRLDPAPEAALIHLVDLPGVTAAAVARLAALSTPDVLARAAYSGAPGPSRPHRTVTLASRGRLRRTATPGARGYLAGNPAIELVESGDVADPDDVDTPDQLAAFEDDPVSSVDRSGGRNPRSERQL